MAVVMSGVTVGARSFQGQSQDVDVSPLSGHLAPGCGEQGKVAQDLVDGGKNKIKGRPRWQIWSTSASPASLGRGDC